MAITDEKTGANLPSGYKWKYVGEMQIDAADGPRIGADSAHIVEGVKRDGNFIWPAKKSK